MPAEAVEERMRRAFASPGHPVAFSTPARVARHFGVPVAAAKAALERHDGYTLHREYKRPRQYNPYFVHGRRELVQADLIDVSKIAASNRGVRFILVLIDVMTKRVWCYALRRKTAAAMTTALTWWLDDIDEPPDKLQTDKGLEFTNARVQALLRARGVEWEAAAGTLKAAVAERVNKTLQVLIYKHLTENETLEYAQKLPALVRTYNTRAHRTLQGMSPAEADRPGREAAVQAIFHQRYADAAQRAARLRPRFRVGDTVRVKTEPKKVSSSSRAYAEQFHGEYYRITRVNRTLPVPMFYLRSLDTGEHIEGGFYAEELQKQSAEVYKIERVLRRRTRRGRREVLVKWKYFGPAHNSWVPEGDIVRVF